MQISFWERTVAAALICLWFCFGEVNWALGGETQLPSHTYFFNHIHSKYSKDNPWAKWLKLSPAKIVKQADVFLKARGMNGMIAITDHNSDKSFDQMEAELKKRPRVSALRSVEWGLRNHMGLIGLMPHWSKLSRYKEYLGADQVQAANDSGALRIINHPEYNHREWDPSAWSEADAVEVWNGPFEERPFLLGKKSFSRSHNQKALADWVTSLESEKAYTALAGSDMHFRLPCLTDRYLFFPANVVFSQSNDPQEVLKAIRAGNVSIQTKPEAPILFMEASILASTWVPMGSHLNAKGSLNIRVILDPSMSQVELSQKCYYSLKARLEASSHPKADQMELRLYRKGQAQTPFQIVPIKNSARIQNLGFELTAGQYSSDFVRAELWNVNSVTHLEELLALTNPVYIQWAIDTGG